jgi:flagellar hook-basal body complex protein FliE
MEGISPIGAAPIAPMPEAKAASAAGKAFKDLLQDSIDRVDRLQVEADRTLERLHQGTTTGEDLLVATRKAQMAFESLMQIREKLIGAFEEIQRMKV